MISAAETPIIESLTVFELRVVTTVLIALFVAIVVYGLIPAIVDFLNDRVGQRIKDGRLEPYVQHAREELPAFISVASFAKLTQAAILAGGGVLLAYVWGQWDLLVYAGEELRVIVPYAARVLATVALVVFAYLSASWVNKRVHEKGREYHRVDQHQLEIVARTTQISMFIGFTVVGLAIWGYDIGGLLVGAGVVGIVLGLAVRETLSSILAGFLMMISRPFEIGDWIQVGEHTGTVMEISILNTHLRNADGERVVIPNDKINARTVINRSRKRRLRLRTVVGIDYDDDIDLACEVAEEAIGRVEDVCDAPTPEVIPQEFAGSSIELEARYWIEKPNSNLRDRVKADVIREVKAAFNEEDISIPFPQRTVGRRDGTTDAEQDEQDAF